MEKRVGKGGKKNMCSVAVRNSNFNFRAMSGGGRQRQKGEKRVGKEKTAKKIGGRENPRGTRETPRIRGKNGSSRCKKNFSPAKEPKARQER